MKQELDFIKCIHEKASLYTNNCLDEHNSIIMYNNKAILLLAAWDKEGSHNKEVEQARQPFRLRGRECLGVEERWKVSKH